jgi:hypothetical protein
VPEGANFRPAATASSFCISHSAFTSGQVLTKLETMLHSHSMRDVVQLKIASAKSQSAQSGRMGKIPAQPLPGASPVKANED